MSNHKGPLLSSYGGEGGSERAFSPSIRSFEEEQVVLRLPGDHVMEETEKRFLWV